MFQCIKFIISILLIGLASYASADVEIKPEDENQTGRHRPLSHEYQQFDRNDLRGVTSEKLAKISFDDPLLRNAYINIFLRNIKERDNFEAEESVFFEDMCKRGDSITPLLLELAEENQDSIFESALLDGIAEVENIDLNPYLEYSRNLFRSRIQTMNFMLTQSAVMLLANHGSKLDLALLEQVINERSYTESDVTKSFELLKRRLERLEQAKQQATRPLLKGDSSAREAATSKTLRKATNQSVENQDANSSKKSWIIWVLFGFIITSVLVWRWKSKSK